MLKKIGITGLLLLFCVSFAAGAVSEERTDESYAAHFDEYLIKTAKDSGKDPATVYNGTITQGETDWHGKLIDTNITALYVTLDWGDSSDSLRLGVYTPDCQCLGRFYDSSDGQTDGRISLLIADPRGIDMGTWYFEIYGYQVTGTCDYCLTISG